MRLFFFVRIIVAERIIRLSLFRSLAEYENMRFSSLQKIPPRFNRFRSFYF
jgi:hypothetical protein